MKTILALVPLSLGLAACQTYGNDPYGNGPYGPGGYPPAPYPGQYPQDYPPQPYPAPQPYPGPVASQSYHAMGTEPGWNLDIDAQQMRFSGDYGDLNISQPTPPRQTGVAGEIYNSPRLNVNIVHSRCGDGMSDRSYPDTVQVYADGRLFKGCGGLPAGYSGEGPLPPGYPAATSNLPPSTGSIGTLAQTNWRVLSIDGQRVPNGGFYINFLPDRMSAKFGCNIIGSGYKVRGMTLTAGALMSTRMACADNAFETKASNILSAPLQVDLSNPERMLLTNKRGTIELAKEHGEKKDILDRILK